MAVQLPFQSSTILNYFLEVDTSVHNRHLVTLLGSIRVLKFIDVAMEKQLLRKNSLRIQWLSKVSYKVVCAEFFLRRMYTPTKQGEEQWIRNLVSVIYVHNVKQEMPKQIY